MGELNELLVKLRGKRSLREISKVSGISHNYLRIIERGLDPRTKSPVKPSPETLYKLATAYDYPYEELMEKAGYLKRQADTNVDEEDYDFRKDPTVKGELRDFLEKLDSLPREKQEEIIRMAKIYAEGLKASKND